MYAAFSQKSLNIEECVSSYKAHSSQASDILEELEEKLSRLNTQLNPIYKKAQSLTVADDNIRLVKAAAADLLHYLKIPKKVENVIRQGPTDDLDPFLDGVSSLEDALAYLSPLESRVTAARTAKDRSLTLMQKAAELCLEDIEETFRAPPNAKLPTASSLAQKAQDSFNESFWTPSFLILVYDDAFSRASSLVHVILRACTALNPREEEGGRGEGGRGRIATSTAYSNPRGGGGGAATRRAAAAAATAVATVQELKDAALNRYVMIRLRSVVSILALAGFDPLGGLPSKDYGVNVGGGGDVVEMRRRQLAAAAQDVAEAEVKRWALQLRVALLCAAAERKVAGKVWPKHLRKNVFNAVVGTPIKDLFVAGLAMVESCESPSRIFVLMDMHLALKTLMPYIATLFGESSTGSITTTHNINMTNSGKNSVGADSASLFDAACALERLLVRAARRLFFDFEEGVGRDPSYGSHLLVLDGTVHPLCASTMSFLKRLFKYPFVDELLFEDVVASAATTMTAEAKRALLQMALPSSEELAARRRRRRQRERQKGQSGRRLGRGGKGKGGGRSSKSGDTLRDNGNDNDDDSDDDNDDDNDDDGFDSGGDSGDNSDDKQELSDDDNDDGNDDDDGDADGDDDESFLEEDIDEFREKGRGVEGRKKRAKSEARKSKAPKETDPNSKSAILIKAPSPAAISAAAAAVMRLLVRLLENLEVKARVGYSHSPALAALFLMNNVHFMVFQVEVDLLAMEAGGGGGIGDLGLRTGARAGSVPPPLPPSSLPSSLPSSAVQRIGLGSVGRSWVGQHKDIVEQYGIDYEEASWKPLMDLLTRIVTQEIREPSDPNKFRSWVKDKFVRVNKILDSIVKQQSAWTITDRKLRNAVRAVLKEDVLPLYTKFWNSYTVVEFSTNPGKYLKYTPPRLERIIDSEILEGRTAKEVKRHVPSSSSSSSTSGTVKSGGASGSGSLFAMSKRKLPFLASLLGEGGGAQLLSSSFMSQPITVGGHHHHHPQANRGTASSASQNYAGGGGGGGGGGERGGGYATTSIGLSKSRTLVDLEKKYDTDILYDAGGGGGGDYESIYGGRGEGEGRDDGRGSFREDNFRGEEGNSMMGNFKQGQTVGLSSVVIMMGGRRDWGARGGGGDSQSVKSGTSSKLLKSARSVLSNLI